MEIIKHVFQIWIIPLDMVYILHNVHLNRYNFCIPSEIKIVSFRYDTYIMFIGKS